MGPVDHKRTGSIEFVFACRTSVQCLGILNGNIKVTSGNIVDNDVIINDIYQLYQKYNIRSLAYDPWRATHVVISLQERGVNVKPFPQSFPEMNTPICEFEKMITGKKIFHNGDPVAKWMLSNVALIINSTGLVKFDKRKSKLFSKRIEWYL